MARGVSAAKEDVHNAIAKVSLYPFPGYDGNNTTFHKMIFLYV
jgi:hypothetical protein